MFNARTKLYAVIGDPIAHSLSPVLQNWMIRSFRLNAVYLAFRVQDVKSAVEGMISLGIAGLNVTVPHKGQVLSYVQEKSPDVCLLGAANTLKAAGGRVSAHVTDPYGFIESLGLKRSIFKGASVVLFGAGGGARSVTFALAQLGVTRLFITDVIFERTLSLSHLAVSGLKILETTAIQVQDPALLDAVADSSIIINASPAGMHPQVSLTPLTDVTAISKKHFVYDLVYNPALTRFLAMAQQKGASVQNGLNMLIYQGLQSLRIWEDENFQLTEQGLAEVRSLLNAELKVHE